MNISFLQLPVDVVLIILYYLNIKDLYNVMCTCKSLKTIIINDTLIWKIIFRNKLILHDPGLRNDNSLSWYNRCRISHNWCHGIYKEQVTIRHNTNYMPWLKFHNSIILSVGSELRCYASDKKGLSHHRDLLWRLEVPKVKRHDVRTNDISRFIVKDGMIVCGNRDGCVAVYSYQDVNQKPRLINHIKDCHEFGQVEVSAVELIIKDLSYIITASSASPTLSYWYCKTDEDGCHRSSNSVQEEDNVINSVQHFTFPNINGIRCLAVDAAQVKLGLGLKGNNRPLLLDATTGTLILNPRATKNVRNSIRDIQWHDNNTICFVTHSGMVQFIDVRSCEMTYEAMDPFQCALYCVKTDGEHAVLVGSSEYCRCVLYDLRSARRHVQMYFTQKKSSPIYSLDFNVSRLIAAADRSVASLDFNVISTTRRKRDYSQTFEFVHR